MPPSQPVLVHVCAGNGFYNRAELPSVLYLLSVEIKRTGTATCEAVSKDVCQFHTLRVSVHVAFVSSLCAYIHIRMYYDASVNA